MGGSKELFQVVCPKGFIISLDRDCWHGHILKKHYLQMQGRLKEVEATIVSADVIYHNDKHGRTNLLYWKEFPHFGPSHHWLKVAAWIVDERHKKGIVTTAHFALFPRGGVELWRK